MLKKCIYTAMQRKNLRIALVTPEWLEFYPDSSCTRYNRSQRGCSELLQNAAKGSVVEPGCGPGRPGRRGTHCSILSCSARLAAPRGKTASKQFNFQKVYSKSESFLQQPCWLKLEWRELNASQDPGLSIGMAFFCWSCFWYFLSLNNFSCLSKTDAA